MEWTAASVDPTTAEGIAKVDAVLRLTDEVSDAQRGRVLAVLPAAQHAKFNAEVQQHNQRLMAARAPAQRGVPFAALPRLCVGLAGTQSELHLEFRKAADAGQLSLDAVPADATETELALWQALLRAHPRAQGPGEEFECAKVLDAMPEVKHWVRNIEQQQRFSFWLPTATDCFYPDFVAELEDGRLFAVEYKGDNYATNDDSREKNAVGQAWARATAGKGVFLMVERLVNGQDMASQMRHALKSAS